MRRLGRHICADKEAINAKALLWPKSEQPKDLLSAYIRCGEWEPSIVISQWGLSQHRWCRELAAGPKSPRLAETALQVWAWISDLSELREAFRELAWTRSGKESEIKAEQPPSSPG